MLCSQSSLFDFYGSISNNHLKLKLLSSYSFQVVENTMLNYLPRQLLAPPREEKKMPVNSVRDHPDYGLAKQLADAGF